MRTCVICKKEYDIKRNPKTCGSRECMLENSRRVIKEGFKSGKYKPSKRKIHIKLRPLDTKNPTLEDYHYIKKMIFEEDLTLELKKSYRKILMEIPDKIKVAYEL